MTGPVRTSALPAAGASTIVRMLGVSKRFGHVWALTDLELDIRRGEVLGCLGSNGAGKTTLIRLLLGMLRPTAGRVEAFGLDATQQAALVHRHTAYVPGETSLWPALTGEQTLHLLGRLHGEVDTGYRDELVTRFAFDPSKRVRAYSKGNRQKLALIAALMTRAELLVLDEPTSGLDPIMEQAFRECVREARERGQTVLLSSHILGEVEALCDRVAILREGQLVDLGTMGELRHLSALTVALTVDGAVPDLSGVPGVEQIVRTAAEGSATTLTCRVHGSMSPLLAAVSGYTVVRLIGREPSLEELFLESYGPHPSGEPAVHRAR